MKKTANLRRILTAFLAAMLLLTASAPAALADSFKAKINSSSAKVYAKASTSAKSVKGKKGVTVTVTDYNGKWAKIKYKGKVGYMPIKYLNLTERIKAYAAKSTSVYKKASSSSRMGELSRGDAVYVIGVDGSYSRVQNKSGSVTGYVRTENLATYEEMKALYEASKDKEEDKKDESTSNKPSKDDGFDADDFETDSSGSTSDRIDNAIELAERLLGRPYASSDNPPSSFNCSSFVKYCMEKGGDFDMKGNSASQASDSNYAKISSVSSLKRGDILFFDTDEDGKCDHSAIYLGSDKFIECSQNAGKVQRNSLNSWYEDHFLHARRPS